MNISRSSESNIWPIQYNIAEVPPSLRMSFLVVQGVWCDVVKPLMNSFLNPFVETLKKTHNQGGVTWTQPKLGSRLQAITKSGSDVTAAMCSVFEQGLQPRRLHVDQGKEFYNATFKSLMEEYNI